MVKSGVSCIIKTLEASANFVIVVVDQCYQLKSILLTVPHLLEDTMDFINRIKDLNIHPENCMLVLFDVVGLYSRLPREEGMSALSLGK